MQQSKKNYKRIVIKIGSSLFCAGGDRLDLGYLNEIARQVSLLRKQGNEVVIVSSGAIALGMDLLKLNARPKELPYLQAAAAVGQNALMDNYTRAFKDSNLKCAQVLLTRDDFDSRKRYLNAKNTLLTLLGLGVVPVINENDTISTDEIKFGDNDRLSALVAVLINADLLVIFSDVDGLLDRGKNVVRVVQEINSEIKSLACPTSKKTCVGGMITKIEAAKIAVDSGVPCIIANGRINNIIIDIMSQEGLSGNWTLFIPQKGKLLSKERWIAFGSKSKGAVIVDDGAKKALLNKKSLLSVGVTGTSGNFENNDIVSLIDEQGIEFAKGKVSLSSRQLDKSKGKHSEKEVIHCDNIVLLS